MEPSLLLDDLDADQRRAVATPSRLVAVIAGAGSGKTRVLTRRVAHRVATGTADARHALVLTFTREAAGELRRRLPRLGIGERVEAGTFHSVMLGLLRQRAGDRGRPFPTVIDDRRRLVAAIAPPRGLDDLLAEVDWASARGVSAQSYVAAARAAGRRPAMGHQAAAERLAAYHDLKRRRGVIDLDDILTTAIDALTNDEAFAEATRWRYRHLFVDEAQDLNPLQHRLVDLLRKGSDDLFLVGDPAQAVYGFNGADPSLLVEVEHRFPGIEIVRLPSNHRCTPQIVEAGTHVLVASGERPGVASTRPDGRAVRVAEANDEHDEAALVATEIRRLDPSLLRAGQVAVLARTRAQLVTLQLGVEAAGVEVRRRLDGAGSPYRDAIASAIRRDSASRLRAWAHDLLDLEPDAATNAEREVATAVLDYLREQPMGDGAGFRTWVTTTDPFGLRGSAGVDLLTFHAAKGREWHTVFVTGVETGLVPHRSATTTAARDEEARLLYVALTRATDELVVSWAARRGGYRRRVSPLLEGFVPSTAEPAPPPPALVEQVHVVDPARERLDRLVGWRDHAARAAGILPEQFCPSATLRTINEALPRDADELAQVTGVGVLTARRWWPTVHEALDGAASAVV